MGKTREIKKRIKAVANIRRITKTMQMIATSKFARAQAAAQATKPYTETLFEVLSELSTSLGSDITHPLLENATKKVSAAAAGGAGRQGKSTAGRTLTLVITSDRGLCGPYNGGVLRAFMAAAKENPSLKAGDVEIVGKKGVGFLKFARIPVSKNHTQFGDKPSLENVRALADEYIQRFTAGEIASVRIVYMKFLSAGRQVPTVMQLLAFQAGGGGGGGVAGVAASRVGAAAKEAKTTRTTIYEFSPDAKALLDDILPAGVKAVLFQVFNDAVVSEHISRMVAMKAATDNAGKAGKKYTLIYNRARQAQITTELTEIISGAAALE